MKTYCTGLTGEGNEAVARIDVSGRFPSLWVYLDGGWQEIDIFSYCVLMYKIEYESDEEREAVESWNRYVSMFIE